MSYAQVRALHAVLMERFPLAFPKAYEDIRPLKIGILEDLIAALGDEVDQNLVRRVVANQTSRDAYLLAVLHGRERVDLQGQPAGPITEPAKALAAEKLKASQQRQKAKAEAKTARRQAHEEREAAKRARRAEQKRRQEAKARRRAEHLAREKAAQERKRQRTEKQASQGEISIKYKKRRKVLSLKSREGSSGASPKNGAAKPGPRSRPPH